VGNAWQRLIALADAVDVDPWRTELRRVWATRDLAAVQSIADRCEYAKVSSESLSFLASCLLELGDRARALQVYRKAHLHHPGDYELVHDLAAELQRDALPPRAEIFTLMRAALALRPGSPHALVDFSTELQAAGDNASARLLAEQALALEPRYARAWVVLAVIAEQAGDLPGVVRAAREALRLRPHWISATLLLADALHRQDQAGEALQVCQELVAAVPESARAQRALGTMQNELGYVAEALEALRASLRLAETEAETHYHLGLALQASGHETDAIAAYRRAIELQPDYAEAHCNLGSALVTVGRYIEALVALRRGHELGRARPKWRHPTERWIAELTNLAESADVIEAAARGESRPTEAESLASLALAVLQAGHARAAFEMLLEVEALDSAVIAPRVRVAVTVAARAASVEGDGPAAAARAKARETCQAWIERALASVRAGVDRGAIAAPAARQLLSRWQLCPELAPMRAADAPDAAVWRKTWTELADLQARLREMD
jgi:tetratricopeptide (TPR) repeat protein